MTKIVHDVLVSCPPGRVFALLSDVERRPEFSEELIRIEGRLKSNGRASLTA